MRRITGLTLVRLAGAGMQLLLMLAVTRIIGAREAGLFYFGFSVLMIGATLCRVGGELSVLRAVAAHRQRAEGAAARQAVRVRVIVTLMLAVPVAAGLWALSREPLALRGALAEGAAALGMVALALPAMALLGVVVEALKGAERAGGAILIQTLVVPGLALVLLVGLALGGWRDAAAAACAVTVAGWAGLWLSCALWRRAGRGWPEGAAGRGDIGALVQVLREAPALGVVAAAPILMQWIGASLLGLWATPEAVAGFAVAMRLAVAVGVVHSALVGAMAPRLAAAHAAGDRLRLAELAQGTSVLVLVVTGPVLLLLALLAELWLGLFGAGFADHAGLLRLLVAGQVVAAVIGHSGTVLLMAGRYGAARWSAVVAVLVLAGLMAGLMAGLVPSLGATGAALAMAGAVVAGHLAGLALVRRDLGFWTLPTRLAIPPALTGLRPGRWWG